MCHVSLNHTLALRFLNYTCYILWSSHGHCVLAPHSNITVSDLWAIVGLRCVCVANNLPLMWPVVDILSFVSGTYICSFISLISVHIHLVEFRAFMAANAINLPLTANWIRQLKGYDEKWDGIWNAGIFALRPPDTAASLREFHHIHVVTTAYMVTSLLFCVTLLLLFAYVSCVGCFW